MNIRYIPAVVLTLVGISYGFLTDANDWDYFVFAQAWPPGTCVAGIFERHTCFVPDRVQTWLIHGLWPAKIGEKGPEYCDDKLPFDLMKLVKIKDKMDTFWPNLYNDTAYDSFWTHEWTKHGTCSLDLPSTSSELQYFTEGLNLNQQYNISRMLHASGIVPSISTQYNYTDFIDAVKAAIGVEPVIECAYEKLDDGTPYHLISQIEICLDKQFKPISCDTDKGRLHRRMNKEGDRNTVSDGTLLYKAHDYRSSGHEYEPTSNCPRHYNFNYPPIQHS